jgi:hypothetical protein
MTGGFYEVRRCYGLRWYDIHTEFHEDWSIHSKVDNEYTQTAWKSHKPIFIFFLNKGSRLNEPILLRKLKGIRCLTCCKLVPKNAYHRTQPATSYRNVLWPSADYIIWPIKKEVVRNVRKIVYKHTLSPSVCNILLTWISPLWCHLSRTANSTSNCGILSAISLGLVRLIAKDYWLNGPDSIPGSARFSLFLVVHIVKSYPCNRPWRTIGLWDVKNSTLSRQSAHS